MREVHAGDAISEMHAVNRDGMQCAGRSMVQKEMQHPEMSATYRKDIPHSEECNQQG